MNKISTKYHSSSVLALKESLLKGCHTMRRMKHTYWQAFLILVSNLDGVKVMEIN